MKIQHLTPEILRRAANEFLLPDSEENKGAHPNGSCESCCAVFSALSVWENGNRRSEWPPAVAELCEIVREQHRTICDAYSDIPPAKRLGARFLWLHFLANVLEDGAL